MPYKFRRTAEGIRATIRSGPKKGKSVLFHTKSMGEAKRRARIRESYANS